MWQKFCHITKKIFKRYKLAKLTWWLWIGYDYNYCQNNNTGCLSEHSCWFESLTGNNNNNPYCGGWNACTFSPSSNFYNVYISSSYELFDSVISNFYGIVICSSDSSCTTSTVSNDNILACFGAHACSYSTIKNVSIVIATGYWMLSYSTLIDIDTLTVLGTDAPYVVNIYNISASFDMYCQNDICQEMISTPTLYCCNVSHVRINKHTFCNW